jgi:hypothetical protein
MRLKSPLGGFSSILDMRKIQKIKKEKFTPPKEDILKFTPPEKEQKILKTEDFVDYLKSMEKKTSSSETLLKSSK